MKKKIKNKLSIIGYGNMAIQYCKVINHLKKFEIVSVVGRNEKKVKNFIKANSIKRYFLDIDEMIKISKPDCILVVVSIDSVYEVIKKLIKFNIKVIIEKPIGCNLEESKKIFKLVNKKNNFFIALNRQYYSNIIYVKKHLAKLNSKLFLQINDQQDKTNINKKKFSNKVVKYWMFANSIHLIDLILHIMRGEISSIKLIRKIGLSRSVLIKSKYGDECIYNSIWNEPGPWNLKINTKKMYYHFINLEQLQTIKDKKYKNISLNKMDLKFKPGLYLLVKDMYNLVNNKKHNIQNINYSHKLMVLINKIYDL